MCIHCRHQRLLVAILSRRKPGYNPALVRVRYAIDKAAFWHVYPLYFRFILSVSFNRYPTLTLILVLHLSEGQKARDLKNYCSFRYRWAVDWNAVLFLSLLSIECMHFKVENSTQINKLLLVGRYRFWRPTSLYF
jgi:hypothetical protein